VEKIEMKKEDFDALVANLSKEAKGLIETQIKDANKGNIDAIEALKTLVTEQAKKLEVDGKNMPEYVKAMQAQLNVLEEKAAERLNPVSKKSSREQLIAEIKEVAIKSKAQEDGKRDYDLKTVGNMSITDNIGAGTILEMREAGITAPPKRRTWLLDLLPVRTATSNKITWVERTTTEGGVGNIAEKGAFSQVDYDFVPRSLDMKKIGVYSKITREMLEDAEQVVSHIQSEMLEDLRLKLDNDILLGNNTGDAMNGLVNQATAFAIPGSFTLPTGVTANEFDVLRCAIAQIEIAKFQANVILLNPTDIMKMDLTRDENGQYILPPFLSSTGMQIKGIQIYSNVGLTAGKFLVFDSTKTPVYYKRGVNVRMWEQNATDVQNDLLTITGSARAVVRVKNSEVASIVYGDFATAMAALQTT
jgi:HK97 family phage major capsid protein